MADQGFEEKSEKATPKKREEARKKGEVARSAELPSVAVLLASLLTLSLFGTYTCGYLEAVMRRSFMSPVSVHAGLTEILTFGKGMILAFIKTMLPLFSAIVFAAIAGNCVQTGFLLSSEAIKPKLSKLDPVKGFGKLFSSRSFMELFKSFLKLGIVAWVAWISIKGEMKTLSVLGGMGAASIIGYIFQSLFRIFLRCTLAMIFMVALDYAFQKWDYEKRLRMSKKEVKDELKKTEGDPLIKSRIRSIQLQMARRRMMQDVPDADVVITNPTHVAVALKYDGLSMNAPRVVAKGAGKIAERIKRIASEHGVPVVENKALARGLFESVEIGREIPDSLYHGVAEVLAYVYRLGKSRGRRIGMGRPRAARRK